MTAGVLRWSSEYDRSVWMMLLLRTQLNEGAVTDLNAEECMPRLRTCRVACCRVKDMGRRVCAWCQVSLHG